MNLRGPRIEEAHEMLSSTNKSSVPSENNLKSIVKRSEAQNSQQHVLAHAPHKYGSYRHPIVCDVHCTHLVQTQDKAAPFQISSALGKVLCLSMARWHTCKWERSKRPQSLTTDHSAWLNPSPPWHKLQFDAAKWKLLPSAKVSVPTQLQLHTSLCETLHSWHRHSSVMYPHL